MLHSGHLVASHDAPRTGWRSQARHAWTVRYSAASQGCPFPRLQLAIALLQTPVAALLPPAPIKPGGRHLASPCGAQQARQLRMRRPRRLFWRAICCKAARKHTCERTQRPMTYSARTVPCCAWRKHFAPSAHLVMSSRWSSKSASRLCRPSLVYSSTRPRTPPVGQLRLPRLPPPPLLPPPAAAHPRWPSLTYRPTSGRSALPSRQSRRAALSSCGQARRRAGCERAFCLGGRKAARRA